MSESWITKPAPIRFPDTLEETLGLFEQKRLTPNAFEIGISMKLFEDIARRIIALEDEARRG
jgi:hypothetical protein